MKKNIHEFAQKIKDKLSKKLNIIYDVWYEDFADSIAVKIDLFPKTNIHVVGIKRFSLHRDFNDYIMEKDIDMTLNEICNVVALEVGSKNLSVFRGIWNAWMKSFTYLCDGNEFRAREKLLKLLTED
nr:MAG: hypothetical protein [Lokiarchaeota virus Ratatoskr Meg22_1012]